MCGRDRSLQRRFPFVDILLHSGDTRDQVANAPKFWAFWGRKFCGTVPKFLTEFYKCGSGGAFVRGSFVRGAYARSPVCLAS